MRSFVVAVIACLVVAGGAAAVLQQFQLSAATAFTAGSVRLG